MKVVSDGIHSVIFVIDERFHTMENAKYKGRKRLMAS
jgi:hypothetical protein